METKNIEFASIELKDGALWGLSDGANMDNISSIIEYVDNAADQNASKISINISHTNHTLTILSIEDTDLERNQWSKLYELGVGGEMKTKKNGVGKYSQGFKYAGAYLIGKGNKGEVQIAVKPISGNTWGAIQLIDYTNPHNYTDKQIFFNDGSYLPNGYNFMVKVVGCRNITDDEMMKLNVELGIRYRERIENGKIKIDVNGIDIKPQDRLYSNWGVRVDYHKPIYFEWGGDKYAMSLEWSDLRSTEFNPNELIDYDTTLGIKGRQPGVNVDSRAGFEIAINGVTIIYDGELKNLIGVTRQPSSNGFRGRLNIHNRKLADMYIRGGNKSRSVVDKSFSKSDDTLEIRKAISEAYHIVLGKYKNDTRKRKYHQIGALNDWCNEHKIDCEFYFLDGEKEHETFFLDKDTHQITINTNSNLYAPFGSDDARRLFTIALIGDIENTTSDVVFKKLRCCKNNWQNCGIIE